VLGFVFTFITAFLLFSTSIFFDETNHEAEQNITRWGDYIAQLSAEDLNNDNNTELASKLRAFTSVKIIHFIDVYKHYPRNMEDEKSGIFASFHYQESHNESQNTRAVRLNQKEKELLKVPRITDDIIEYIAPIHYKNEIIGHIYLQIDRQQGNSFKNKLLLYLALVIFFLLILLILVVFKLEGIITAPLRHVSQKILDISQTKDYSMRLENMPYKEADIIARNMNNLLTRTERHITKLGLAEQQSLKLNIELEDKVNTRTAALKESNQDLLSTLEELHQFQDQLVESEKMASLGDMVAGVAHEVNTPIGLGVTASTLLSDRLEELKQAFDDKTLKSSQLKRFLTEGHENVGIIYRNLNRAAELISSFKKVAVDQSSEDIRQFNMAELLHEVLLTLAPQIRNTPYSIEFDCPDDLFIVSKPGPINQILINLILNSIIHGFENRDYGTINIHIMQLSEQLNVIYRDNGKGIDSSIRNKIFDPFTTTKRGEGGSGLGLHLVYNLVTQALGGTINLENDVEIGASFEINFPINEQSV